MGHALTPESDLAVGDKSFAEFYQVVKDTEKGIELMQDKRIIDRSKRPDRLTKAQSADIYQGLKSIEDQYSVRTDELRPPKILHRPDGFLLHPAAGALLTCLLMDEVGPVVLGDRYATLAERQPGPPSRSQAISSAT